MYEEEVCKLFCVLSFTMLLIKKENPSSLVILRVLHVYG